MVRKYIPISERDKSKEKKINTSKSVFTDLMALHKQGKDLPTFGEYIPSVKGLKCAPHNFYQARTKLMNTIKKDIRSSAIGDGRPASVVTVKREGRPQFVILWASAESPKPEIMAELMKMLPSILGGIARNAGVNLDDKDLEIKTFSPEGWEIRMALK